MTTLSDNVSTLSDYEAKQSTSSDNVNILPELTPVVVRAERSTPFECAVADILPKNTLLDYEPRASKNNTLVLSGGGTKGVIILGALQYLIDTGELRDTNVYVGTSVGSIICYLLSIGYTPIECVVYLCTHKLIEKIQHFNLVAMINGEGAISYNHIQESLEKMTIEKIGRYLTLKELYDKYDKKLVCVTYNQTEKKPEYLSVDTYPELPCLIAIRMSSNVPFLFNKFKYMGNFYVDGGICDNFAVLYAEKLTLANVVSNQNNILGVRVQSKTEKSESTKENGVLQDLFHFMSVPIDQSTEYKISLCDPKKTKVITLTDTDRFAFDFNIKSKEKLELFSHGYTQVKILLN